MQKWVRVATRDQCLPGNLLEVQLDELRIVLANAKGLRRLMYVAYVMEVSWI